MIGGIIAILLSFLELLLAIVGVSFGFASPESDKILSLYQLVAISITAGCIGIAGGAIGKKIGGIMMLVSGVMALIGAGFFGVLPFALLISGGIVSLRKKPVI